MARVGTFPADFCSFDGDRGSSGMLRSYLPNDKASKEYSSGSRGLWLFSLRE
jgi:hypothetical protein